MASAHAPLQCWAEGCAAPSTSACGRCRTAEYCGAPCQRAHWRAHKPRCKELEAAAEAAEAAAAGVAAAAAAVLGAGGQAPAAPRTPGVYTGLECRVQDYHCALEDCGAALEEGGANAACSGCRAVVYCDVEHQCAHWAAHKEACFAAVRLRVLRGDVHEEGDTGKFVLLERLRVCQAAYGPYDARTLECMRILGLLLAGLGRLGEAESLFRQCLASAGCSALAAARAVGAGGVNQPAMPDLYAGAAGGGCVVEDYHCALRSCGAALAGGAAGGGSVVCPGCCAVGYCDGVCQGLDWQAHRALCACVWAAAAAVPPPLPLPLQPALGKKAARDYTGLTDRQLRTELLRRGVRADGLGLRSELLAAMVSCGARTVVLGYRSWYFLCRAAPFFSHPPLLNLPTPSLDRLCLTLWTAQCVTPCFRGQLKGSASTATFTALWRVLRTARQGTPSILITRWLRRLRWQGVQVLGMALEHALPQKLAISRRRPAWILAQGLRVLKMAL